MRMLIVVAIVCFALPSFASAATATWNASQVFGPRTQMIGHWTFDGPDVNWTTGVARDRSGWGNHASMIGLSTTTSPVAGKLGQGMRFMGSTVDYVNAGSAASLDNLSNFTISMWVKFQTEGIIVQKTTDTYPIVSSGWRLEISGGTPRFSAGTSGSPLTVPFMATLGSGWRHLTLTWTGELAQSAVNVYVDGVLAGKGAGSNGTGTRGNDDTRDLTIGGFASQGSYHFNGTIDDVRIFSRILTPQEIAILAKAGRVTVNAAPKPAPATKGNLVGHWTFDGPDVNWTTGTVLDKSGQGNHGSMFNLSTTSSPAIGKLGQAFRFKPSPTVDYVNAGSAASLDNLSSMSISMWVKSRASQSPILIQKGGPATPLTDAGWRLDYSAALQFSAGFLNLNLVKQVIPSFAINTWSHVVVTWDGSGLRSGVAIYQNGILSEDFGLGGNDAIGSRGDDSAMNMTIGGFLGQSSYHFNGDIDDVRIYNRVLTPAEIATLYRSGTVTVKPFTCGVSTITDADGNVYNTVKIGTQCWMKQNMRVGTMMTGFQTNNGTIEKRCFSNTLANCMTNNNPNYPDGGLYQWDEAMQYSTTPGARGICPAGWHIPTHDEFTTLERAVCTSGTCATDFPYDITTTGHRGTTEGTKLKPNGSSGWEGNLAGRMTTVSSSERNTNGYLWSSSKNMELEDQVWFRLLNTSETRVLRNSWDRYHAFSVRCVQD